jgi:hypothetical protein
MVLRQVSVLRSAKRTLSPFNLRPQLQRGSVVRERAVSSCPSGNDAWADANNVIANIGYIGGSGQRFSVDYGVWMERERIAHIPRGHTKNLIVAITESEKNFAITDLGPSTNYMQARVEEAGELAAGEWKMIVTLSADNFRRNYAFDLTVGRDASISCRPEGMKNTTLERKISIEPSPNVGSLVPEVKPVEWNAESDVWSKVNGKAGAPAALLPFTNAPRPPVKTAPVEGLRARLTYYENHRVEEYKRIDSGCWSNEAYRSIDLRVGDIVYLIAAVQNEGFGAAVVSNPRYSSDRYSEDRTVVDTLPPGSYEVKVDLFGGEHGQYAETYWYGLEVGDELKVKRINQRLAGGQ